MPQLNLGRAGFVQKGVFALGTQYEVLDVVTNDGEVSSALVDNIDEPLTNNIVWQPWLTKPDLIEDNEVLLDKAYSSSKTRSLHNLQANAIANLAASQGVFGNSVSPIFVLTTDEQILPFSVIIDSTDTSVFTFDASINQLTLKKNTNYNFRTTMLFLLSTGLSRTITITGRNASDNSVVYTRVKEINGSIGNLLELDSNQLLTVGSNGIPSANLTLYFTIKVNDAGVILQTFESQLVGAGTFSTTIEASNTTFTPVGDLESTNVQEALTELQSDIDTKVSKDSNTGAAYMPSGTTAQRPISPSNGYMRYNTDLTSMEAYSNGAWGSVGGGATGGGTDNIFYENGQVITADYTIPVGKNAMSAGDITINTGVTVTVSSGSKWSIV